MVGTFFSKMNKACQSNSNDDDNDVLQPPAATPSPQSIIVRIWIETNRAGKPPHWYGHLTIVESDKRIYVKNLDEVTHFFATYLNEVGVRLPLYWRLRLWLRRLIAGNNPNE
jgi:hypothetical protein